LLRGRGARVVECPTIQIVSPQEWGPLDRALKEVRSYDWVVFTSVNGVRFVTERLAAVGEDPAVLMVPKVAAIGPGTREALESRGMSVQFMPQTYQAEAVAEGLIAHGVAGSRVLLPRAETARDVLPRRLRDSGALVDVVVAYRTLKPADIGEKMTAALKRGVDVAAFTSSSTVRNFMEVLPDKDLLEGVRVAVIGPITGATAESYGLTPCIVAEEFTVKGLVDAIVKWYRDLT